MSDLDGQCEQVTPEKVSIKPSQNGIANSNHSPSSGHKPNPPQNVLPTSDDVPLSSTDSATQDYDNPAFSISDESLNVTNSAYITPLNGTLLNETSITIPDDALLNHHSGRVRLKKKEEKLGLNDMNSKSENGHSVPLTNGVWVVANGKPCDVSSPEKREIKETVPVNSPVTAEKFNSKKVLEEYFIPANTHKKFLRGEKLYLSNDSEMSPVCRCCSWKRALVVVLVVVLLAGAGLLGALAATGFFSSQEESNLPPASPDLPSHSAHTSLPPVSQPRGGLPRPHTPSFTHLSSLTNSPKKTTSSIRRSEVGDVLPLTSAVTSVPDTNYSVPKDQALALSGKIVVLNRNFTESLGDRRSKQFQELASDLEKRLENVYSNLKSFAHAKVLSFQPSNSIIVQFVLTWRTEGVSEIEATHLLFSHLNRHGGFLGQYLLDPLAIKIRKDSSPNATDISLDTTTLISSPANESMTTNVIVDINIYNESLTTIENTNEITSDNSNSTEPRSNSNEKQETRTSTTAPRIVTNISDSIVFATSAVSEVITTDETTASISPNESSTDPVLAGVSNETSDINVPDQTTLSSDLLLADTTANVVDNTTENVVVNTADNSASNTTDNVAAINITVANTTDNVAYNVVSNVTSNVVSNVTDNVVSNVTANTTDNVSDNNPTNAAQNDLTTVQAIANPDNITSGSPGAVEQITNETYSDNIPPQDIIYTVDPLRTESSENLTETTSDDVTSTLDVATESPESQFKETAANNSTLFTTSSYNTTNRAVRMETEQPEIPLPELIYNVTDETTTSSASQDETTTQEPEPTTHGTSISFTDSVATLGTFAMTIWNDTEDSTEHVPTDITMQDENTTTENITENNISSVITPSNNPDEVTNAEIGIWDVTGENSTDFNSTEEITTNVTENSLETNNTELNTYTTDNISEVNDTESNSTIPDEVTVFENQTFNISEYENNDNTTNGPLTEENETKEIPETSSNVTNFDYFLNGVTESGDNVTEMEFDERLATNDSFVNENNTVETNSSIDATTTDSSMLDGNSTVQTTFNVNGTTLAMENETYIDEDTLSAFNESSDTEMYHHTPDADNVTMAEGCPEGTFLCPGGTECLTTDKQCNGMFDCADQSDESNCEIDCGENFQCTNTSKCIMKSLKCDGMVDCDDSSDEENCAPKGCDQHEVMCLDRSVCIKALEICDGRYNCHDKSDERDCVDRSACQAAGQFYCNDGLCLPPGLQCDGSADCRKGEDEENCTCPENQFQCADGKCIEDIYRCDGHRNCSDGSDEMECMRVDDKGAVLVLNGVTKTWNLLCVSDDMPWEEEDGHKLCQELGFSSAVSVGQMAVVLKEGIVGKENAGWTQKNMSLAVNASYWTTGMTHTNSCDSGLVATLTCTRYECGQLLTADGQTQTLEQWPFLASIIADGPAAANGNAASPPSEDSQTNGNGLATQSNKIFINNNKSCRAEILSPLWLVTAAGCIQNLPKVNLSVHIDQIDLITSDLNPTAHQRRQVSHIAMHPHLSRFRSHVLNDYDLALVRLDQPLNFSKMAAVCLPDAEVNPGITCFTGSLSSQQVRQQRQQLVPAQQPPQEQAQPAPEQSEAAPGGEMSREVTRSAPNSGSSARFLPFMVQNRSSCNMDSHYKGWVGSRMFCTGNSDEPCHDEAAPLMCLSIYRQWYLAGILSYHRFCGIYKKHPSVYANVFPMRGYIEKVIGMRQYNVTYDPNTYELAPPEFTAAPTTTTVPLVEFVPSEMNGTQSESFIRNNQSIENVPFSDTDTNVTYEDRNFTASSNESYINNEEVYEDPINETHISPVLYAAKQGDSFDYELNNINTTEIGLESNTSLPEPGVIYERSNATESNMTVNETSSSPDEWNEDFNLTNAEFLKDYYDFMANGNFSDQDDVGNVTDGNMIEDVDLCNRTDIPSFQCLSGDGCVLLSTVCDGNYNCDDQSDEWQCLRLDDRSGILEVRGLIPGNNTFENEHVDHWTPVCADEWQGFLSHRICHQLGYKSSLVTSYIPVQEWQEGRQEGYTFRTLTNPTAKLVQGALARSGNGSCVSEHLLAIHCSELQCSLWSAAGDEELTSEGQSGGQQTTEWGRSLASNTGGSVAQDGQWPSLIILQRKGRREPCTANVLSQKWLLTAWSCLFEDRYESGINASQWEAISNSCPSQSWSSPCNGETVHYEVDKVVAHPEASAGPCAYDNDLALVHLSTPLPFGRLTNAVCLPQQQLQPQREVCFLASFYADEMKMMHYEMENATSVYNESTEASSVRSSLQYLSVPNMERCPNSDNATEKSPLLCSQVNLQNEDNPTEGGGASLMCINENHQWELHGLATPTVSTNSSDGYQCKYFPQGTYTNLFAYSQWIAEIMRSQ